MRRCDISSLLLLALVYTGLASIKPIHVDEAANYYYARQIANDSLDPYGFEMFWYQELEPANHVLTPPVLVYWWGLGVRLFGHLPVLWKIWLLPFVLLFVFSLHGLLARFALDWAMPLTWATVLSPAFLPSLNLMPDIPAMASSLAAVAVFLRVSACAQYSVGSTQYPEGRRHDHAWALAAFAGLLTGIGMQTKYTAFVTPAVLLLWAFLIGRPRHGFLAVCIAAAVFVGWEALVAWKYGESHFWHQLRVAPTGLENKLALLGPGLPILGGVASGVSLLALAALGVRRRIVIVGGAAILLTIGLLGFVGAQWTLDVPWPTWLGGDGATRAARFTLATMLFGFLGSAVVGTAAWLAWKNWDRSADGRFLVGWLVLELAGYVALSPFPAVRRTLGVLLVLTLLVGRVMGQRHDRSRLFKGIILLNVALGLLFFVVDVYDARAQMLGARAAANHVAASGGGRAWYAGHWGFQFYAEETGMTPLVPGESILQAGDWLVIAGTPVDRPAFELRDDRSEIVTKVEIADWLPWKTVAGYYGGQEPLDHRAGARLVVEVRQVTGKWTPASPP